MLKCYTASLYIYNTETKQELLWRDTILSLTVFTAAADRESLLQCARVAVSTGRIQVYGFAT